MEIWIYYIPTAGFLLLLLACLKFCCQDSEQSNQDDDVWNISSRVNQQNQDGTPPNWPTHDHRLSMDFVITPEYNIKDTRPPPPPYSELDLPSYEQATGCRPPRADLTPVHQQSDQNRPGPSS
ncbi:uncharacterized protein [Onthophagus taurus]|uniref:uncharacterized protein isoform X22 n=1 Tax=Onthophagus taurus TaxID=166361 RepID=UPI000C200639|nr:uncharacterized protein LOC111415269 isoform X11 [Onthophagus taurus]